MYDSFYNALTERLLATGEKSAGMWNYTADILHIVSHWMNASTNTHEDAMNIPIVIAEAADHVRSFAGNTTFSSKDMIERRRDREPEIEYKVLSRQSHQGLSEEISKHLNQGWKLHGQISVVVEESWGHFKKQGEHTIYSQAVVR